MSLRPGGSATGSISGGLLSASSSPRLGTESNGRGYRNGDSGGRESTEGSSSPDMESDSSLQFHRNGKRSALLHRIPEDMKSEMKNGSEEDRRNNNSAYHLNQDISTARSNQNLRVLSVEATTSSKPCLCTPARKIPRPRNAFILFRQANQASVVADNPGIANPDISKIIGQIWRAQPQEVRDEWKSYAEDEKAEHRKLYPNYRYQPRRAGRMQVKGGQPGPGGANGASETDNGEGEGDDPNHCPKCGGRYIVTPRTPSTPRIATGSAGSQNPMHSSASIPGTNGGRTSGFGHPYGTSRPPSPRPNDDDYFRSFDMQASGRRPLPHHGRLSDTNVAGASAADDMSSEHDIKRRRYDGPTPTPTSAISNRYGGSSVGGGPGGSNPAHRPYQSVQGHRISDTSIPTAAAASSLLQTGASSRPSQSSWPGSPLPLRREANRYPEPISVKSEYGAPGLPSTPAQRGYSLPMRLPPPSSSYGYYKIPGNGTNGMQTPSSALSGLSIASTPASSTPSGAQGSRHQQQPQQLGFNDASLKLPPLQTHMETAGLQLPAKPGHNNGAGSNKSTGDSSGPVPNAHTDTSGSIALINDVRSFAFSSTPVTDSCVDKTSQESGIQAMVMSIPYLNKIEVLRRISPRLPLTTKRGPIIAIEGQSTALIAAVSRVVEKALRHSSECSLRVWGASTAGQGKDEGNIDEGRSETSRDSYDSGKTEVARVTPLESVVLQEASRETLASYHAFMLPWHAKSQDIIKHITKATPSKASTLSQVGATGPKTETPAPAAPTAAISISNMSSSPPAPPSPTSPENPSPSPTSPLTPPMLTPSRSPTSSPGSGARRIQKRLQGPSSVPPLPVALITGGYSVALADHFATHVPIEDEYAPIDHWHWMATLWRGVVQPDLVVYADTKPQDKHMDTPINRNAQEGVMVVHAPPKTNGDSGTSGRPIDEMTERRLAFEVMEWVRASPLRAMWVS